MSPHRKRQLPVILIAEDGAVFGWQLSLEDCRAMAGMKPADDAVRVETPGKREILFLVADGKWSPHAANCLAYFGETI